MADYSEDDLDRVKQQRNLRSGVRVLRGDGTTSTEMPSVEATWKESCRMRRFVLHRIEDETGVSGTGDVAEGVLFTDGTAAMRWTAQPCSTVIYNSVSDLVAIHGHGGKTVIRWVDG